MRPEQKVLKAYHDEKATTMYFNQLKRATGLSDSSLATTLKRLTIQGTLDKHEQAAITTYTLTTTPSYFQELDKERFQRLPREIRHPLEAFLEQAPKELHTIILFGSASRHEHTKKSDIDLLAITHRYPDEELQKAYEKHIHRRLELAKRHADAQSNHPLNLFTTTDHDLKEPDALTRQALTTGFPVAGHQRYHELR